jgi:hypothetical protein
MHTCVEARLFFKSLSYRYYTHHQPVAFDSISSILSIPCCIRLISARRSAISSTFSEDAGLASCSSNCVLGKLTFVVIILPSGEAFEVACRLVRLSGSVPRSSSVRPLGVSRAESSICRTSGRCSKTARMVDCVLAPRNELENESQRQHPSWRCSPYVLEHRCPGGGLS